MTDPLTLPCRLWAGHKNRPNGYGQLYRPGQKPIQAHRLAWEQAYGPIPEELFVLHRCDVRTCVEPTHLWLGTAKDNARDCWAKGRGHHNRPHARTTCRRGHPFSNPHSNRRCAICRALEAQPHP
jgi:hypothetical protein